jgi:hypothetical protein
VENFGRQCNVNAVDPNSARVNNASSKPPKDSRCTSPDSKVFSSYNLQHHVGYLISMQKQEALIAALQKDSKYSGLHLV